MKEIIKKIEQTGKLFVPYGLVMLEREYKKYKKYCSFKEFLYFYIKYNQLNKSLVYEKYMKKNKNPNIVFTYQELYNEAKHIYRDHNIIYIIINGNNEECLPFNTYVKNINTYETLKKYIFCKKEKYSSLGIGRITSSLWENGVRSTIYITEESLCINLYERVNFDFVRKNIHSILKIYRKLEDKESKDNFMALIQTLSGEHGFIKISSYAQYEHPFVHPALEDIVIDGGILDGVVTAKIAQEIGDSGKVYAFEPVKRFYDNSKLYCEKYQNIILENYGLWSGRGEFSILIPEGEGIGGAATFALNSEFINKTKEICKTISIDEYFNDKQKCDLIKLDIEGAEYECLKGAEKTINKFHPKLQISIYHSIDDYIRIPLLIMEKYPWYKLYLGCHTIFDDEIILYCK